MRKILSIAVVSAILSVLLFFSIDIGFYKYIIVSGLLISFFSINYCICKNKKFYRTFLLIDIINIIVFLVKKYFCSQREIQVKNERKEIFRPHPSALHLEILPSKAGKRAVKRTLRQNAGTDTPKASLPRNRGTKKPER